MSALRAKFMLRSMLILSRSCCTDLRTAKLKSCRQRKSVAAFCYKFQDQVTSATVESPGARRARTGSPNLNSIKRVSRRLENACTPRMAGACNLFRCAVDRLTIACRPQRSFALSVPRSASIWADGVRPAVENTEWSAMGARRAANRLLSPPPQGDFESRHDRCDRDGTHDGRRPGDPRP
jgi:hypothetical protein